MRGLVLALIVLAASSCCSIYMVPELNTCGVVIKERDCRMEEGDKLYLVQITEKTYIEHPTYKRYRVGDTICFKSTIKNFK
jgi:hypothetical protein